MSTVLIRYQTPRFSIVLAGRVRPQVAWPPVIEPERDWVIVTSDPPKKYTVHHGVEKIKK